MGTSKKWSKARREAHKAKREATTKQTAEHLEKTLYRVEKYAGMSMEVNEERKKSTNF